MPARSPLSVPELVEKAWYPGLDMSALREYFTTYFAAPGCASHETASELAVGRAAVSPSGAAHR